MEFYFQSNSVLNSLKCPKSKSLSHCLTELFQIHQNKHYQNKHWTIRRRDDQSIGPSSHSIMYIEDWRISSCSRSYWMTPHSIFYKLRNCVVVVVVEKYLLFEFSSTFKVTTVVIISNLIGHFLCHGVSGGFSITLAHWSIFSRNLSKIANFWV